MKKNRMKRILSMTLATVISLSLCVPAFAEFTPQSSHEYYEYEYTNYVYAGDVTISEAEAQSKDLFTNRLAIGIGAAVGYVLGNPAAAAVLGPLSTFLAEDAARRDPLHRWGDYSISVRYLTKYRVNMYTGKRTQVDQWLCAKYDLFQNGQHISTQERQVRMK